MDSVFGCLGILCVAFVCLTRLTDWKAVGPFHLFQGLLVPLAVIIVKDTSLKLAEKMGLPLVNQIISWAMIGKEILCSLTVISLLAPIFSHMIHVGKPVPFHHRLVSIFLAFAPLLSLLSLSFEPLFYAAFFASLVSWALMEQSQPSTFLSNLRISSIYLLFINVAFFGTGNIASLSSFSLESVYRLVTVFDPFLMGALLILKILIPFFLLSAVYGIIMGHTLNHLFLLVIATTDIATLNFFYLVRDSGSWLEIGTSISHFVIVNTFILFQILLYGLSQLFIGGLKEKKN
jgi:phosphatidylinositol glycan class N